MSGSLRPHNTCGPLQALEEVTWQRLVTLYGYDHARRIVRGEDGATNADLAAWRTLGQPKTGSAA